MLKRKVFDSHFHIGSWGTREVFGKMVAPLGPASKHGYVPGMEHTALKECEKYIHHYGITRGVVVCNYLSMDPEYSLIELNKTVLEAAKHVKQLYAAIFVSPLPAEWPYTQEALRWLDSPRVKALKMTSTNWTPYSVSPRTWDSAFRRNMYEILEKARERRLPIQFHTGHVNSLPQLFDEFLEEIGRKYVVHLVHSGESVHFCIQFVPLFQKWLDAGYLVYCDTSLCPGFVLPWLLRAFEHQPIGYDRILFATDSPWGNFPSEYWKVESLDIIAELKRKIFWLNAERLYESGLAHQ
jgi:predicted TIM-barrel fold metal-dependent hydrolase